MKIIDHWVEAEPDWTEARNSRRNAKKGPKCGPFTHADLPFENLPLVKAPRSFSNMERLSGNKT